MGAPAYFELQAEEPARAAAFYAAAFGWRIVKDDAMPIEYWRVEVGEGIDGAILARPAPAPPPESGTNAAVLSMRVESFDATAKTIADAGGAVALAKFAVPGRCWQGYFLDTEGNTFGVFEVDRLAG